jgi:hypothetical protein
MTDKMVELSSFEDEYNALISKSKLEALGIEAIIVKNDPDEDDQPVDLDSRVSVFVREEDFVVAREILEETSGERDIFSENDF